MGAILHEALLVLRVVLTSSFITLVFTVLNSITPPKRGNALIFRCTRPLESSTLHRRGLAVLKD